MNKTVGRRRKKREYLTDRNKDDIQKLVIAQPEISNIAIKEELKLKVVPKTIERYRKSQNLSRKEYGRIKNGDNERIVKLANDNIIFPEIKKQLGLPITEGAIGKIAAKILGPRKPRLTKEEQKKILKMAANQDCAEIGKKLVRDSRTVRSFLEKDKVNCKRNRRSNQSITRTATKRGVNKRNVCIAPAQRNSSRKQQIPSNSSQPINKNGRNADNVPDDEEEEVTNKDMGGKEDRPDDEIGNEAQDESNDQTELEDEMSDEEDMLEKDEGEQQAQMDPYLDPEFINVQEVFELVDIILQRNVDGSNPPPVEMGGMEEDNVGENRGGEEEPRDDDDKQPIENEIAVIVDECAVSGSRSSEDFTERQIVDAQEADGDMEAVDGEHDNEDDDIEEDVPQEQPQRILHPEEIFDRKGIASVSGFRIGKQNKQYYIVKLEINLSDVLMPANDVPSPFILQYWYNIMDEVMRYHDWNRPDYDNDDFLPGKKKYRSARKVIELRKTVEKTEKMNYGMDILAGKKYIQKQRKRRDAEHRKPTEFYWDPEIDGELDESGNVIEKPYKFNKFTEHVLQNMNAPERAEKTRKLLNTIDGDLETMQMTMEVFERECNHKRTQREEEAQKMKDLLEWITTPMDDRKKFDEETILKTAEDFSRYLETLETGQSTLSSSHNINELLLNFNHHSIYPHYVPLS